jgi:hypothetical protein
MDNIRPKRAKGNLLIIDDDLSPRQTLKAFPTGEGYGDGAEPSAYRAAVRG